MGEINNKKLASISLLNLPSFPDTLLDLIEACRQTFPDSEALEAIVSRDIALCTRLLDVAAAHMPSARRVTRIADLIDEVGVDALRTLAMSVAVNLVFAQGAMMPVAEQLALRRKSLERAFIARHLAARIGYPAADEAFLCGLLQGLGELALATQLPEYRSLSGGPDQEPVSAATERAELEDSSGADEFSAAGAALGHWVVRNMQLDSLLADALLYCCEPFARLRAVHPLLKIARVANALAQDDLPSAERQAAADLLVLRGQELDDIRVAARTDVHRHIGAAMSADVHRYTGASTSPGAHSDAGTAREEQRRIIPFARGADAEPASSADKTPEKFSETQRYWEKHKLLVEQVRRQGLLSNTRPKFSNGGGLHGVLLAVRKSLHILFGHRRCSFFTHDSGRNSLQGTPLGADLVTLGEFVLPCSPGVSVVCDAFLRAQPVSSAAAQATPFVVDQLLMRLIGADALLCLPLAAHERKLGVLVIGVGQLGAAQIEAQTHLLQTFAQQASFAVARQLQPKAEHVEDASVDITETLQRIAHDVSNPLAIMKNYVKILRMKLAAEDAARSSLTVIDEEIDRVTDIIRAADKPNGDAAAEQAASDLNETVFDIVRSEGQLWAKQGVSVRTDLRHAIPPLNFDRAALRQVLLNLLRNAAESMATGGEVVVATRRDYVSDDGKLCIEIIVKDNGPGIPQRVLDKLFQPVRSAKGKAHAGLGLHIVRNLVMQMGGIVQCHSTAARGTLFQILLPQPTTESQPSA
jgi:signal transduction histidine kinase/HD-like signal output (HDOD) protein